MRYQQVPALLWDLSKSNYKIIEPMLLIMNDGVLTVTIEPTLLVMKHLFESWIINVT